MKKVKVNIVYKKDKIIRTVKEKKHFVVEGLLVSGLTVAAEQLKEDIKDITGEDYNIVNNLDDDKVMHPIYINPQIYIRKFVETKEPTIFIGGFFTPWCISRIWIPNMFRCEFNLEHYIQLFSKDYNRRVKEKNATFRAPHPTDKNGWKIYPLSPDNASLFIVGQDTEEEAVQLYEYTKHIISSPTKELTIETPTAMHENWGMYSDDIDDTLAPLKESFKLFRIFIILIENMGDVDYSFLKVLSRDTKDDVKNDTNVKMKYLN